MSFHESSGLASRLSGSDAVMLLEIIGQSLRCRQAEHFMQLFPKIGQLFPFEMADALLGRIKNSGELVVDHIVNVSFPDEWLREYQLHDYFQNDGATKEALKCCGLEYRSYFTTPNVEVKGPKEIMALNMDFGINEGYFHGWSSWAPDKYKSKICFMGARIRQDKRTETILEILVPHLHLALRHIFENKYANANCPILSAREEEVLQWLKEGKSSWEISVILGISESTVNYHVYNIIKRLDASNRTQALAIAARLGIIDLD